MNSRVLDEDTRGAAAEPDRAAVLVIDPEPASRVGLREFLSRDARLRVCDAVGSAHEARATAQRSAPQLAVVAAAVDGADGCSLVRDLWEWRPGLRVAVVLRRVDAGVCRRVFRMGALACLTRQDDEEIFHAAMGTLLAGERFVSPRLQQVVLGSFAGLPGSERDALVARLSDRELEIFRALGRGLGTRQIADELRISPKTVETHQMRLREKLGLDSGSAVRRRAVLFVQEEDEGAPSPLP